MNPEWLALAEKRGALRARIALQRDTLGDQVWPVVVALGAVDKAVAGVHWVKRHPEALVAGAVALAVARPKRARRWATRGFFLWRSVRGLREKLDGLIQIVAAQGRR